MAWLRLGSSCETQDVSSFLVLATTSVWVYSRGVQVCEVDVEAEACITGEMIEVEVEVAERAWPTSR